MGSSSTFASSHAPHATPAEPHVFRQASQLNPAQVSALEFTLFAETLRQDLAPASLLEHVLAERVVLASWRLHNVSLNETRLAELGGPLATDSLESRLAESDLTAALALIQTARNSLRRCITPDDEVLVRPRDAVPMTQTEGAEQDDRFDPLAADLSNECPYIAERCEEFERDIEDDKTEQAMPVRWQDRLVFDFSVSETSPVIKGTWITVSRVVSLIVDGWNWSDVLRAHPELTEDDIRTCLAYSVEQDDQGEY
jgi:uncharacterized protein (DUF433 family)